MPASRCPAGSTNTSSSWRNSREPGGVRSLDKYGDIGALFTQRGGHGVRHLFLHVDLHLRVQLAVLRQQRRQKLADGGAAGTQVNVARRAPAQVSEFSAKLVHGLQQRQAVLDENATCGGGLQAARMAVEQRVAQRHFKFPNAPAGRAQCQVRAPRRCRQAAGLGAVHGQANRHQVKPGKVVAHGGLP
jgi:hypothetical protein